MKLLFFDVETNGLPKDYRASYEDIDNWPRVISLAACLADSDGNSLSQFYNLIKPEGWEVPKEKFWIDNGYSTEKNLELGFPIMEVLQQLFDLKQQGDVLVAHNLNFDHRIVWAEFIRAKMEPKRGMHKMCTMMLSTKYCQVPHANGRGGYKWPTLAELHHKLFGRSFDGAHDATADVLAMKDCFFELLKRKVISLPEATVPAV